MRPNHILNLLTTLTYSYFVLKPTLDITKSKSFFILSPPAMNGIDFKPSSYENGKHNGKSSNRSIPRQSPVFKAWLNSRRRGNDSKSSGETLHPGTPRPLTIRNLKYALQIMRICLVDLLLLLWRLHPIRTSLLILLNLLRGFFPAARGYSQSLILNEVGTIFF